MQIDIRVMELLASKICHDLVSPVSAINNGVELIEDIGGSVVEEAMKLIGDSGATASRRLRLFRMAYGRAGSEENLSVKDARQVAEQYLAGGKASLDWPENQPPAELAARKGFLKTILNLIILAEETLAYGGGIALRKDGEDGCRVEITGRNAQLGPQLQEAFEGIAPVDSLSPRSVQAYIVGRLAAQFGFRLAYDQSVPDHLQFMLHADEAVASVPLSLVNL